MTQDELIEKIAKAIERADRDHDTSYWKQAELVLSVLQPQLEAAIAEIRRLRTEESALKSNLNIDDLPPESERTNLEEWQACYAMLLRQMNQATAEIKRLREREKVLVDALEFANAERVVSRDDQGRRVTKFVQKKHGYIAEALARAEEIGGENDND